MDNREIFDSRIDLEPFKTKTDELQEELAKVIVGQKKMIRLLIVALFADGHVLIEGVPGIAKTLVAKLLARTMSVGFSRIQFTPDLMPSDIIGTSVFNVKENLFEFNKGPIFSNIILIDEINRAPAKTQSALFEVMEENQITVDGTCYRMDQPFNVFATQNPIEHEGTYRLPEAQLDRFLFKIDIGYPSLEEETMILLNKNGLTVENELDLINPILENNDLASLRKLVGQVHVEEKLMGYIASIVQKTRSHADIFYGASPRASLAILSTAKVVAALEGRDFVSPDDIKEMALPALRHRIMLTSEREMEGVAPDEILRQVIESIEVPM